MIQEIAAKPSFANIEYSDIDACVSWHGTKFHACGELDVFLNKSVKPRLDDDDGKNDFRNCLNGLNLTGMGKTCLEEILNAEIPESSDWAIGEAFAEAWLIHTYGVVFPWNMERDKRNTFASLPGADLVGFIKDRNGFRFVLGEVKTSAEEKSPPQVMSGRSGMHHQLDNLTDNMSIIRQLLIWLFHRTRNKTNIDAFKSSCIKYFNSQFKDIVLFGVLIRDTNPNALDLSGRGEKLREKLSTPTHCQLIALYLPWGTDELSIHLRKGGDK